ncbi:girdin isoform X2 [Ischnura elegans]|uniref:girdin isoform X2 n=1 Tax=Ischnura elegans TaxID=197161 RepID=UPI001ED86D3E|nr:girdin isoform X2 [Ischnura elegans]
MPKRYFKGMSSIFSMASAEADVKTMDSSVESEQFMASPLVTWFQSCLSNPEKLVTLDDLVDGVLIHEVILLIQPNPEHKGLVVPSHNDPLIRIRNMVSNVQNVRAVYENDLFQTILVCPDPVVLAGGDSGEGGGVGSREEQCLAAMHLMLLLLLGAAVQGPSKEPFIEAIKQLPLDCQHSIVDCIKQVTNSQELVLTQEWEEVMGTNGNDVVVPELLASHVVRLAKERDAYLNKWTKSILRDESGGCIGVKGEGPECEASRGAVTPSSNGSGKDEDATREKVRSSSHHQSTVAISVEVSELKARIRRLRQELEERTETLGDCREELKQSHAETSALRRRVQDLTEKAREYASYQDELDALRERAVQADQMEEDIRRYKERLRDMEVYRAMVDELREDNRVLQETKDLLEDQLSAVRPKAEKASLLQSEVNCVRREMMDLKMEREAEKAKAMELGTEAMRVKLQVIEQLREALKSEHRTKGGKGSEVGSDEDEEEGGGVENRSLSDQLSRQAEARVLRLELENSRLTAELEAKKQEMDTEVAARVDSLQAENKRLTMKVEQLQEESGWWNSEREQLEGGLQEALVERRRLQNSLDSAKEANKAHVEEKQLLQAKLDGRDQSLRELRSENQRLTDEIRKLQAEEERRGEEVQKARDKVASLQREVTALLREISNLKEDLEAKEVSVEQLVCQGEEREDQMQEMTRKIEDMQALVNRLQDVEREVAESQRKALEDQEALVTLQGDLVQEKTKRQIFHNLLTQVECALSKIGVEMPWNLAEVEVGSSVDPDLLIDRIKCSEEMQRIVKELLPPVEASEGSVESSGDVGTPVNGDDCGGDSAGGPLLEASAEKVIKLEEEVCSLQQELKVLREERERGAAKMVVGVTQEVEIATLQSRIQSLTDQHTALHLANSQLVAEKDELVRELEREQSMRKLLLQSQEKLDCLHNDLTSDYEHVARERDVARAEARAAKVDAEACGKALLQLKEVLQAERNTMHTTSSSLANLRDEHSRLKEDFRWVYSVAEKQKAEIKALKLKNRALENLHQVIPRDGAQPQGPLAEMRREGEMCASDERARLEAEVLMLRDMNAQLIEERRSLMNHASKLLNECHGLFSHSLEDKQHFHKEERAFMDHVNDLKRQKEKLEEKIMELYRSSESSSKKKSFGANLVKKVRKAGSDFISKVPRGGRTWHRDGRRSLSHSNVLLMSDVASGSGGDEDDDRADEEGSSGNGEWDASAPASIAFGGAGSRQGVYYTGATSDKSPQKHSEGDRVAQPANTADVDVPCFTPNDDATFPGSPAAVSGSDSASSIKLPRPPSTKPPAPPPPTKAPPSSDNSGRSLLVYNRITANIGLGGVEGTPTAACSTPSPRPHPMAAGDDTSSLPPSDENEPQWYEFGCV